MTLLFGIAVVIVLWWASKLFASANPKMLAKAVKTGGGVLSLGVAGLLMMRGRLDMAIFVGGIGAYSGGGWARPRLLIRQPLRPRLTSFTR